ncbi:hypothetical protein COX85_00145 [Candidatus Micrarchaeota archaeon CG_4_10_14_0_2_um_filter_55_9]|nr:MAG: hypothetical protein AUJ15_03785 [Candidatus Micrarchaeota archaeon CG1_02_55_41]PIO02648.1 MAG: hypothetical protein COT57_03005 [Candidatus Micrarchaeota archaeon CG09_land_8_20_14_0_10_55_25]PIZ92179.1 MAG: hypothetical protein COX85_00145 [Candidatus Micrarchaeota archaeon CG_4_10_14_0_2_um_filter_55_9]PJD01480.1 MAG: hypothetical protein COU38_00925 [Candidatus Micrarchaeota archaeon CG10_big_fil_rev_8_21_14_0_10_54_18]
MEKPRIAVYHSTAPDGALHEFVFHAVGEGKPPELPGHELISTRKPPERFASAIKSVLRKGEPSIGVINYSVNESPSKERSARTYYYYPKSDLVERGPPAPGLGAYLELIAANYLKNNGVQVLSSTESPNPARTAQLRKAGLYHASKMPVSAPAVKWMKGLGRVLRRR